MSGTADDLREARRRAAFLEGLVARAVAALGIGRGGPEGIMAEARVRAFEKWLGGVEEGAVAGGRWPVAGGEGSGQDQNDQQDGQDRA